jgi:hypothetical protein
MFAAVRIFLTATLLAASLGAAAEGIDFGQLEKKLQLKPEQKAQFDKASSATQRALVSSAMAAMELKSRLQEELLKPKPDFGALVRSQEAVVAMNRPLFREAHDEWSKLYELLDDGQTAVAKAFIEQKLGLLAEAFSGNK